MTEQKMKQDEFGENDLVAHIVLKRKKKEVALEDTEVKKKDHKVKREDKQ